MHHPTRLLASQAICLYIAAYLLTIMLHEVGHALLALALGDHPILYSTSVRTTSKLLSNSAHVLIAAAGPVLSLLQGSVLLELVRRYRPVGRWGLLGLYLAVFGLINFFGYVLITPFVAGGDTGQIVARLHVPAGAQWGAAGLALAGLIWLIGRTGPLFGRLLPGSSPAGSAERTAGMRALLLWPWLVGSVVLVLLAWPAPHPAVIANMCLSPMVLRRAYATGLHAPATAAGLAPGLLRAPWLPGLGAGLLALGFRALSQGVAW